MWCYGVGQGLCREPTVAEEHTLGAKHEALVAEELDLQ